jgi:hypothetical protein
MQKEENNKQQRMTQDKRQRQGQEQGQIITKTKTKDKQQQDNKTIQDPTRQAKKQDNTPHPPHPPPIPRTTTQHNPREKTRQHKTNLGDTRHTQRE